MYPLHLCPLTSASTPQPPQFRWYCVQYTIHSPSLQFIPLTTGTLKGKKKMDRRLSVEGGLFRQQSPWLPGLRKINPVPPVELTSVSSSPDPATGADATPPETGTPPLPSQEGSPSSERGSPAKTPDGGGQYQPPKGESQPLEMMSLTPQVVARVSRVVTNGVKVSGLLASWSGSEDTPTLKNLSFEVTEVS